MRPAVKDIAWAAFGVASLVAATFFTLHYYRVGDLASRTASREKRLELVAKMSSALSSSAESEKSAVMAVTDEESGMFADQARASSAELHRARDDLGRLLEKDGTSREEALLARFSQDLTEMERIDQEVLDLAVRNTNLKAYAIDFGPAEDALAGMDAALSRILKRGATSTAPDARETMLLAAEAQSAAWRIQALLPPHISDESDEKMDSLEKRMATEDETVRGSLKALRDRIGSESPDLETADTSYTRFTGLRRQILDLSRQNTNVRSLIISLNQKRKAAQVCKDDLTGLEQEIEEESLAVRTPMSPR